MNVAKGALVAFVLAAPTSARLVAADFCRPRGRGDVVHA